MSIYHEPMRRLRDGTLVEESMYEYALRLIAEGHQFHIDNLDQVSIVPDDVDPDSMWTFVSQPTKTAAIVRELTAVEGSIH